MRHTDRSEQQAKIVVDFGDGPDGRTRAAAGGLLLDRDRWAKSINCINIRTFHLVQKLPRVGRKSLDVTALSLGINRVEGKRGLPRPAQPGHDRQGVPRNLDVDVLEIVLPGATDRNLGNRPSFAGVHVPSVTSTGHQNCSKVGMHSSTPYLSRQQRGASTRLDWGFALRQRSKDDERRRETRPLKYSEGWSIVISLFMPVLLFVTVIASVSLGVLAAYVAVIGILHAFGRNAQPETGSPAPGFGAHADTTPAATKFECGDSRPRLSIERSSSFCQHYPIASDFRSE